MSALTPEQAKFIFWHKGNLSYKFHEGQKLIHEVLSKTLKNVETVEDKKIFVLCARRFGKSYLATVLAIEMCLKKKFSKVIILALTKEQSADIFDPLFEEICRDAPHGLVKPMKSRNRWKIGKSFVVLSGYETIADNLRGQGADLIIIDEASLANPETYQYIYRSVLCPIVLRSHGKLIFLSTPPVVRLHPFMDNYRDATMKFKYTIYQNPMLSPAQIEQAIKDSGGVNSPTFQREYMCEEVFDDCLVVIPKFDPKLHVYDKKSYVIPPYVRCWLTIDAGGIQDKTGIILSYFDHAINKTVFHKIMQFDQNTTLSVIVKEGIKPMLEEAKSLGSEYCPIFCDGHGQTLVDLQHEHGITAILPHKQDKDEAILALNNAFYMNKLIINPDCIQLIRCIMSALFNKQKTDVIRTAEHGHADLLFTAVYAYRMRDEFSAEPRKHYSPDKTFIRPVKENNHLNLVPEVGTFKIQLNNSYGGIRK